jgi:thiol:disulfide interchange protein
MLNFWYVLGLLSVFWALAVFAVSIKLAGSSYAWGQQFSNTGFQIALISFVFMMALSFLGVWEIPIPGFAMSRSATGLQQQEGASGAYFKGAFTTLLATPCSGPFLGVVFAYLAVSPTWQTPLVFTSIGLGMGSPFLLLGAYPGLARILPKPGDWMETVKHVMGFVLLFVTAWLFWSVSAKFVKPTFLLLMGIWLGCWLAGRVPAYAPLLKRIQGWSLGIAVVFAVGFFGFALLDIRIVKFIPYNEEQLARLQREGKTVMIDFTAAWCFNCHTNFAFAINTYDVEEKLKRLDAVAMLADLSEQEVLDRLTPKLEELGAKSIPLLAIYPGARPHQPIVLRDLISKQQLLNALEEAGHSREVVAQN